MKNLQFVFLSFFLFFGLYKLIEGVFSIQPIWVPVVGFIGTYFYIFYWSVLFIVLNNNEKNKFFISFIKIQLIFSVIIALSAIYQFLFDMSLFGFNTNSYLSDLDSISSGKITKRATSFLGPQVLGLYMFIFTGPLLIINFKKTFKYPLFCLYFIAGIMSGSAAFIGSLIVFIVSSFFLSNSKEFLNKLKPLTYLVLIVVAIFIIYKYFFYVDNAFLNAFKVNMATHIPYYINTITNDSNQLSNLYGNGLGTTDRLVEVLYRDNIPSIWKPKNESYITKIFYEIGIIGIISLLLLLIGVLKKLLKYQYDRRIHIATCLILGCLANLVISPAFTGFTMAYFIWPLLLFPIFFNLNGLISFNNSFK